MVPTFLQWNPGLDNDDQTMQEILNTLPGNPPKDIHRLVRLFENPASPIAFTGAINLPRHDCVHIMLGRGLSPQDEAFVIGFTMGTSKSISRIEVRLFELISKYVYPPIYKFSDEHLKIFELGLEYGKECSVRQVYNFPFEDHYGDRLGALREEIGLSTDMLRQVYRREQEMIPDSVASLRLPV